MLGFDPLSSSPLSDLQTQEPALGVSGTGNAGSFTFIIGHDESTTPLGVHGTGFAGTATRVAVETGVFTTCFVADNTLTIEEVDKTLSGVFATGVVNILFSQLESKQLIRETVIRDNPIAYINQLVREGFLTEHTGNAIINIKQVTRETHTLNADAIVAAKNIQRETIILDGATDIEIKTKQVEREVVLVDPVIEARSKNFVRELLMSTTPKYNPSIVLVVT